MDFETAKAGSIWVKQEDGSWAPFLFSEWLAKRVAVYLELKALDLSPEEIKVIQNLEV